MTDTITAPQKYLAPTENALIGAGANPKLAQVPKPLPQNVKGAP